MADWKKVLVSGSNIDITSITASVVPEGSTGDRVLVRSTDGGFKSVTQGSIQGTTEATFQISGSTINDTSSFDGTGDVLLLTGSNQFSVNVTEAGDLTTVKLNLPPGTISGSSQITLQNTDGFNTFSASLASDIADNLSNINSALSDIDDLEDLIDGLVDSSSQLINASSSIASNLVTQGSDISTLQSSITSLNNFSSSVVNMDETGSFVVSASVVGTTDEIEVTANGSQGIQIGLPNDVTISGILEADAIFLTSENVLETGISQINGSTSFGTSGNSNTHKFTGSLQITGALDINNTNTNITISELNADNSVGISDIIVRSSTDKLLHTAGDAIGTAISGAFGDLSSSFESRISLLSSDTTTTNANDITALQATSQSLVDSASLGLFFNTGSNTEGTAVSLGETASFTAEGDGLSVDITNTAAGTNIKYSLDSSAVGNAIGAFSSSAQLQGELDSIYVQLNPNGDGTDVPISGALQLQTLGFITASDFNQMANVPTGLISASGDGLTTQGNISLNGQEVEIFGLGTDDSPTFQNLTITNNLTVNGPGITSFQVEDLNIEDQFILLNSGANGAGSTTNDKDGGFIVDNGGGSGSLFMYDHNLKAWGFKGATDDNKVNYNETSNVGLGINPEVFVGTVSSSTQTPSAAPAYGVAETTAKGQMHINTSDSSIWIYV